MLAVPDKRYCFGIFQPVPSAGEVGQADVEQRTILHLALSLTIALTKRCRQQSRAGLAWSEPRKPYRPPPL